MLTGNRSFASRIGTSLTADLLRITNGVLEWDYGIESSSVRSNILRAISKQTQASMEYELPYTPVLGLKKDEKYTRFLPGKQYYNINEKPVKIPTDEQRCWWG